MNSSKDKLAITVRNTIADCDKLFALLEILADRISLDEDIHNDLKLVIEETFVNIVSYAFEDEENHEITLQLHDKTNKLDLIFIDDGCAFDPLNDSRKVMDRDNLAEGGMGIHIIRSMTDEQRHERIEQRNVFTLTKHYTK